MLMSKIACPKIVSQTKFGFIEQIFQRTFWLENLEESGHNFHPLTAQISRKETPGGNSDFRNRGGFETGLFPCRRVWIYFLLFRAPFIALASALANTQTTRAKINICCAFSPFRGLGKSSEAGQMRHTKLGNRVISTSLPNRPATEQSF